MMTMLLCDDGPAPAPDINEVPDLLSACARMDIESLSEVTKAL